MLGGRYRLDHRLGEGGMSVVWRAHDEVLDRAVAVKVLIAGAAAPERIVAEAKIAARLSHPHVASVYDFGESADGVPYIVMELLQGGTLGERLAEGPLGMNAALRVCAEVASALAAAHAEGLVHRDVKPANIVLTPGGAKVVDFGIAASAGAVEELDVDRPLIGTPAYLAPERLIGGEVVPASDVYALGLLLYRLLSQRLPWRVETTTQMLTAHVYLEPDPLPPIPGLPPEVAQLCQACLAKAPADRPPASEVAAVLAEAAVLKPRPGDAPHSNDVSPAAPNEPAKPGVTSPPRQRTPLLVGAGAATAAVIAATVAFLGPLSGTGEQPAEAARGAGAAASSAGRPIDGGGGVPSGGSSPIGSGTASPPGALGTPGVTVTQPDPNEPRTPVASTAGPGPGGPGPTTGGPSPMPPASNQTTLSSRGGSVVAACQGNDVLVKTVTPASGYTVRDRHFPPARQVVVMFDGPDTVKMKIRCDAGVPSATTETANSMRTMDNSGRVPPAAPTSRGKSARARR
jgi:serine/threonine-protein kinase